VWQYNSRLSLIVTFVIDFSTSKKLTDLFFSVIPPDINLMELTLADLKLGYSQTITELNAYTVNKPTTHPTHVDRNQHGKSNAIIVTTWGFLHTSSFVWQYNSRLPHREHL
jgi:hypothetical protein